MLGSFRIGTAFGIAIRVHWLFAAMVIFVLMLGTSAGVPALHVLGFVATIFGVVVLHELGHSLVAQHFGIRVLDITLWPLGGMARMSEIPENSRIEGLIAVAGPMVNFALAAITLPLLFGTGLWSILGADGAGAGGGGAAGAGMLADLLLGFVAINLLLGGFNLVPAFPMDGGRLLRAWFARKGDWLGATERAVRVGRFFALLMVVGGIWNPLTGTNLMLSLVGLFVWFAGSRELLGVRLRHARSPFTSLEGTPLGDLLSGLAGARGGRRGPGGFRPYGGDAPEAAPGAWATAETPAGPAAPPAPDGEPARRPESRPTWTDGPWTEERIRELERFRGRLRREP